MHLKLLFSAIAFACSETCVIADDKINHMYGRAYIHDHFLIAYVPAKTPTTCLFSTNLNDYRVVHIGRVAEQYLLTKRESVALQSELAADRVVGPPSLVVDRSRIWLDFHQLDYGAFGILKLKQSIQHLSADEFCKGNLIWIDNNKKERPNAAFGGIFWGNPENRLDQLVKDVGLDPRLEYATVPIGELVALRFELTFTLPNGKPLRKAQLGVYRLESKYDDKMKMFLEATSDQIEEFPADFREPFDAIVMEKSYIFITHSGKLYRAEPAADPTKPRQTKLVDGLPGPIVAVISNANKPGEHYLVCHDGDGLLYKPLHENGKPLQIPKRREKMATLPYEPILDHVQTLINEKRIVLPIDR